MRKQNKNPSVYVTA